MNLFIVHIKLNRRMNFNGIGVGNRKEFRIKTKININEESKTNNDMRILKISLTFFLFYLNFSFANEGNLSNVERDHEKAIKAVNEGEIYHLIRF